jgi:hypothetical protein
MTVLRILLALGGAVLLALIVWASFAADIGASFSEMIEDPWGVVALFDLYLGFLMFAPVIWLLEPDRRIALAFILPLPFLGNVWAVVWLVWRLGRIAAAGGAMKSTT